MIIKKRRQTTAEQDQTNYRKKNSKAITETEERSNKRNLP